MYFIKKYLPVIIIGILLSGCQETIEIPYDKYNKKIVVYCMLEPGKVPEVIVMESQNLGVPAELQEEYAVFLTDAVVKISEGGKTYLLHLEKDPLHMPDGKDAYFFTDSFLVEIGKTYQLEVSQGGRTVNAETYVLEPVSVGSIEYEIFNLQEYLGLLFGDMRVKFHLYNPPGNLDNFDITVLPDNDTFGFYGNVLPISRDSITEKSIIINDFGFNTEEEKLKIKVFIYNYPKATADFLESLDDAYYSGEDPFSEVAEVVSNVNGGLGLFGARTVSDTAKFEIKIK